MKASTVARKDIQANVAPLWDRDTWDQYNVTVSHLFTKEARRLNTELQIN